MTASVSTRIMTQYPASTESRAARPQSEGPPAPLNPTASGDWRLATPSEVIETFELLSNADAARSLPDATQARMAAVSARAQDERGRRDAARAGQGGDNVQGPLTSSAPATPTPSAAPSPSVLAKMFDTVPQPSSSTVTTAA